MADSNVQENGAAGTSLEEIARQRDEARQQAESDAAQKLLQEMKEKEYFLCYFSYNHYFCIYKTI